MDKIIIVKDCRTCPKQHWNDKERLPFCSLLNKDCQGGQGVPLHDCPLENFPPQLTEEELEDFLQEYFIAHKNQSEVKFNTRELAQALIAKCATEQKEYCKCKPDRMGQLPATPEGLCGKCGKPIPAEKKELPCEIKDICGYKSIVEEVFRIVSRNPADK